MTSILRSVYGRAYRNFGEGRRQPEPQSFVPIKFNNFAGAFIVSDAEENIPQQASSDALDMEVDNKDALVKAPGTMEFELFDVSKSPKQMALFVGLSLEQELILFDPPSFGIKKTAAGATSWIPFSMPTDDTLPFFWTTFADYFIFANGLGVVQSHQIGSNILVDEPLIPNGSTFAVMAARLFVGAPAIDGVKQPMVVAWSGIEGYNKFDYVNDLGSGFEPLIGDQSAGDAIVAIRAMGLDMAAIICRNSIWIGRRTGDLDRPLDFQPRVTGKGCVAEATVRTVLGGVIYLGSEGLELFDGNNSNHIGENIDADLLPLDYSNIHLYGSAYDSIKQRYFLFTPTATYVLDMNRGRWYKRSMVAYAGVPFSETLPGITWDTIIGAWQDNFETWLTLVGDSGELLVTWDTVTGPWETNSETWLTLISGVGKLPVMTFLGKNSSDLYALHRENYASYGHFGYAFVPRWHSLLVESPEANNIVTTKAVYLRYKQSGTVDLYLPNLSEVMTKITAVVMPLAASAPRPALVRKGTIFTGLVAGFMMEYRSGVPEISEIELSVLPRGPRITATPSLNPLDFFDFSEGAPGGPLFPPAMIVIPWDAELEIELPGTNDPVPITPGVKGAPIYVGIAGTIKTAALEIVPDGDLTISVLKNGLSVLIISVVGGAETVVNGLNIGIVIGDTLQAEVVANDTTTSYALTLIADRP